MTDVTIRGIDDDTYAEFAAEAKKRGLAIGELTTIAMRSVIAESSKCCKIGNLEYLTVTKEDLLSVEGQVTLENIELLEFDDTVDWTTFKDHVKEINNVDLVRLPRALSKFQVLTKSKNVTMIQTK